MRFIVNSVLPTGVCYLLITSALLASCTHDTTVSQPLPSPTADAAATPRQGGDSNSLMRRVDFSDFSPVLGSCSQRIELDRGIVRLTNENPVNQGSVGAAFVDYGDVTGDGQEEAFVAVAVETTGSAIPYCAYVYTLDAGAPKLLWSIQTGDRAEGGLGRLYSDGQRLMIELYSPADNKGACCPTKYTRMAFKWNGITFQQLGGVDVVAQSADAGASPRMSKYSQR